MRRIPNNSYLNKHVSTSKIKFDFYIIYHFCSLDCFFSCAYSFKIFFNNFQTRLISSISLIFMQLATMFLTHSVNFKACRIFYDWKVLFRLFSSVIWLFYFFNMLSILFSRYCYLTNSFYYLSLLFLRLIYSEFDFIVFLFY